MGFLTRGAPNVLRNPLRLVPVVLLLGTSLMFTGAMVALNAQAQTQFAAVQQAVDTRIDLMPAGFITSRGKFPPHHNLSEADVKAVRHIVGVAAVSESFVSRDPSLRSDVETPHVLGTTPDPQLTLDASGFPRILTGRDLTARDTNANVAITSPELAHANGWHLGSRFNLHGTVMTLVGLFTTGNPDGDNYLILPYQSDVRIYHLRDPDGNPLHLTTPSQITVYAARSTLVPRVVAGLHRHFGNQVDVVAQEESAGQVDTLGGVQQNVQAGLVGALVTAVLVIVFAVLPGAGPSRRTLRRGQPGLAAGKAEGCRG